MKRGVTLIELIFVIVVIGILSAVIAPSFTRPTLSEAANQIVSHIRYTQHLAMVNNKFDPISEFWYQTRWQLDFRDPPGRAFYTIYQDLNRNGSASTVVGNNEIAKKPSNPRQLLTALSANSAVNSEEMILSEKYGILDISFSPSCSFSGSQRISFDYLGRPLFGNPTALETMHRDNFGVTGVRLIRTQCIIELVNSDGNISIAIEPETGYTHVLSN